MQKEERKMKTLSNGSKRKLSSHPTTFKFQLDDEQKQAKALVLDNTVSFLTGPPGTSKTFLAVQVGLDGVISGQYSKMIVSRPMVDVGNSMGFLPGDAFDFKEGKMAPYLAPVLQQMYKLKGKEQIDKMIEKEQIQIVPLQFIRGLNFEDCVVVVDEGQNMHVEEAKALVTRICNDAKLIITSDYNQIDLRFRNKSLSNLIDKISHLEGVCTFNLTKNYRHPLALEILSIIQKDEDERESTRIEIREERIS